MKLRDRILKAITGDPVSVGLDIGNHSVKVTQITHSISGPVLTGAGIHVFKEGTLEGGEIKNRDELLGAITSLIAKTDPKGKHKRVNFSLSWSYGVIADRIRVRSSEAESDEDLIFAEAGRRSPFDVEDIQLDYKILSRNESNREMEVLLVAAKLKMMQPFLGLIRDAGLEPAIVDVDTFAASNAYLNAAPEDDLKKVICLVNLGHNVTNVTFIKHGHYHSTRDIATAGQYFIHTLQQELQVDAIEAVAILKGRNQRDYNQEIVLKCIESAAEEISVGLDLSFSYFQSSESNLAIDKLVLCGGGACIEHIARLFHERHDIETEVADPLKHIKHDSKKFESSVPQDIATVLMVSTGLALRKP